MVKKNTIFPPCNILDLILFCHSFRIRNYDVILPFSPEFSLSCCFYMCSKIFLFIETESVQLKVLVVQKVAINLLVEVCRMLNRMTN